MTFIPIDLRTLRKNPDFGKSSIEIEGQISGEAYVGFGVQRAAEGPPDRLGNFILQSWHCDAPFSADETLTASYRLVFEVGQGANDVDRIIKEFKQKLAAKRGWLLNTPKIEREKIVLPIKPQERWLYRHTRTGVGCRHCGEWFPWTEIGTAYLDDDEGNEYVIEVCPECGRSDPLEEPLEFETITAALRRKGKRAR